MPFEPISPLGNFIAGPELPKAPEPDSSTLGTIGKIAAPVAIGAGLVLAPEFTIPALAVGGGAALLADREAAGAAFRQENTIGSLMASQAAHFAGGRIDPQYDPFAEIADTPYEAYSEKFALAQNREHAAAIRADIDRENKDRKTIGDSGIVGMGATMAAGILDWPTLLPAGAVLRTAKGEVSVLRSAAVTAGAGAAGAGAAEAALQGTQQLRTGEESAINIAGGAVLAGLLGGGVARSLARHELEALAPRVERDFEVPGAGQFDPFEPGSLRPSVEAAPGAGDAARAVADSIRETAEAILPPQVRVQVVDSLGVQNPTRVDTERDLVLRDLVSGLGLKHADAIEGEAGTKAAQDALISGRAIMQAIGLDPKLFGQGGRASMTFGMREDKSAAFGAFKPRKDNIDIRTELEVPVLTQAHEWWHYLDHYFAKIDGGAEVVKERGKTRGIYMSDRFANADSPAGQNARAEIAQAFDDLNAALLDPKSGLVRRADADTSYAARPKEIGARAFQVYIADKLGIDLKANAASSLALDAKLYRLTGKQRARVFAAFDKLFDMIKVRETPGGKEMYSLTKRPAEEPRTNSEGFVLQLPFRERWGDPRFNPADKQKALARIAEIEALDPRKATWAELAAARNDLREISSQLFYYRPGDDIQRIIENTDEVWSYVFDKARRIGPENGRPSIFNAPDVSPEIGEITAAGRAVLDKWWEARDARHGIEELMQWGRTPVLKKPRTKQNDPARIAEARGGFYFKAARDLAKVPDALFAQGGQAVINHLEQAGVKRAEITHFGLDKLAGKKPVTRAEFEQQIADRIFEFRRKTSWFNPESNARDYEQGGTRAFSGPRIPGRGIYFERLMAFPKKLKGGEEFAPGHFESPHWEGELPGTWASWRGSVRDVPDWGKMVVGEEGQTDLMQGATARDRGGDLRRPRVEAEEFLELKKGRGAYEKVMGEVDDLVYQAQRAIGEQHVWGTKQILTYQTKDTTPELWQRVFDGLRQRVNDSEPRPERIASKDEALKALDKLEALKKQNPGFFEPGARGKYAETERSFTPTTPLDESYVRTMARDLLLQASAKKADSIAISTSETTARIQNTEKAAHFYDQQMKPALERELRRITGDGSLTLEKVALPKAMGGKREKPYTVWAAKIDPQALAKISEEGQPIFGVRSTPTGLVAEGRFDPQTLLMTIAADALDPLGVFKEETIHALRAMGLFTRKEWSVFENAAQKEGWVEKHDIRQLYGDIYKSRLTNDLAIEEAVTKQFRLWRGGEKQFPRNIAELFERIQAFLERMGNALRGRGFQTADDVFAAVRSGEIASRAAPGTPSPAVTGAAAASGRATSVGASAVQRADDTLKSAFGMEKAMAFQDPMLRLQTSPSPLVRRHVQELAETPLTYDKNALGEESAPGGSEMGAPGAVETRMKFWQGPLAEAVRATEDTFLRYRKGRAKRFVGEVPALTLKDTLFGTEALTYRDFKFEAAKAARRGDQHAIPEVAAAAKAWRDQVFEPLKDEAIAQGRLPEGINVKTALSYLTRMWNRPRIIAERDQVKARFVKHLEAEESINRGVRTRLSDLLSRHDKAEEDIAKIEARIPRREAKLKEIEARAEEAGRVQHLAFRRALERREPIDQLRGRISDLSEQIAGPLDTLGALREVEDQITLARQIAKGAADDQPADLAGQIADAAELEESLAKVIADAEASIERIAESGDLPLPRIEGRYQGPSLSYDEIDEVAASWRFLREMRQRRKPESLTRFVTRMGGVEDPGGDVLSMIGRKRDRPGLIRSGPDDAGPQLALGGQAGDRANTLDDMALRAWENGFFPGRTERPTINDFLGALREDLADGAVVRGEDQGYFADAERAITLGQELEARGIEPGRFKREGQLRVFLGQAPSDAFEGEARSGLKTLQLVRQQLADTIAPYREQISTRTREARRRERTENLRQSERGVFASQARNRSRTLADQRFARLGELEKMRDDMTAAETRLADTQKAVEEEIGRYQGKSASEAKRALERRAEAERMREDKRQQATTRRDELVAQIADEERALIGRAAGEEPDAQRLADLDAARQELAALEQATAEPGRLRAADKPVLAAARSIAAQLDKEPGELADLADEIIDRILGTPDGRLPYDAHLNTATSHGARVEAPGPLQARSFMISDYAVEQWLENDIEAIGRAYVRTMAPDIELTKRFGSVDMKLQIKEIAEDYAKRAAQATTPAERKRLHKRRDADIEDLAAIRDRLRGTYNVPSNPDAILVRAGRVISSLNYMRMLGGMTLSAIPDVGGIVFSHGMLRVFGDGIVPLLRNWQGARVAMTEVKMAGTALDMVLDSRAMQIADVMDEFGRHSKFERAVSSAARNFGVVSLQAPWNAAMKQFAGLITMTRMLRALERVAAGKAKPKEIERLAAGGISQANARRIAEQFAKHGRKGGGVWFANTAEWDAGSRPAIEAFRAGLVRDVDRIIITPGQDRPLWMSSELGRLVGQFKSFAIAAMQRVVIAGLQQRDMATLNGIILMTALGGLSGILKAKVAGQPGHTEWDDPRKNAQFLVEAIDRSGLTGWLMDVNSMTEKLSRGAVGLSAVTGKPVSRYAQRNLMGSLLGPTAGTAQDFFRIAGSATSGEWNQSDSRAMRRLIPYNNIFYLRKMFDEAETGINEFLGVPKPAGAKR